MKHLPFILACVCAGCATKPTVDVPRIETAREAGTSISTERVRTPETIKAYPVGRYTDPNFPNEMHERHTIYRREQQADWNYLPDAPYALPIGPVVADSNPSPSYYANPQDEQTEAQQRGYAEALAEQNRELKKRVDELQKVDSTIHDLRDEIERLKMERDSRPESIEPKTPVESPSQPQEFSSSEEALPQESGLPQKEETTVFLFSQMRLNDELSRQLDVLQRRRFAGLLHPCLQPTDFAFTTQRKP